MLFSFYFSQLIRYTVPETLNAALEDIDVLFETNPTWFIGPGSRKKLAKIVANRKAAESIDPITGQRRDVHKESGGSEKMAMSGSMEKKRFRLLNLGLSRSERNQM